MSGLETIALPLLARVCLIVLFPFSALDKIVHWEAALEQADSSFLPGGRALLVGAIVVEFVAPVCIVVHWHERIAALVLALFCVFTALLYHRFWTYPGFWSPANEKGRAHLWDFLKNFGLVGGLLLVVVS